jgi:hypothetical protein
MLVVLLTAGSPGVGVQGSVVQDLQVLVYSGSDAEKGRRGDAENFGAVARYRFQTFD